LDKKVKSQTWRH